MCFLYINLRYFHIGAKGSPIVHHMGSGSAFTWPLVLDSKAREIFNSTSEKFLVQLNHKHGFVDLSSDALEVYVNQKTTIKIMPKHFDASESFLELPRSVRYIKR